MTLTIPLLVLPCALYFLWMGAMAMRFPSQLLRGFGVQAQSPDARNEIRAVYGGFGFAMAGMLAGGLIYRPQLAGIALTLGLSMGGMAAGRLISALVERQFGRFPIIFFFVELALMVALLTAFQTQ